MAGSFLGRTTTPPIILEPLPPPHTDPDWDGIRVDKIAGGAAFTVIFDNPLLVAGGHIGTIYAGVALRGTYTSGTGAWHVWGPNGVLVHATYSPDGSPDTHKNNGTTDPKNHQLELWGAGFTFDTSANLYHGGIKVGTITV